MLLEPSGARIDRLADIADVTIAAGVEAVISAIALPI
jgi:hypothetical protein